MGIRIESPELRLLEEALWSALLKRTASVPLPREEPEALEDDMHDADVELPINGKQSTATPWENVRVLFYSIGAQDGSSTTDHTLPHRMCMGS